MCLTPYIDTEDIGYSSKITGVFITSIIENVKVSNRGYPFQIRAREKTGGGWSPIKK